MCDDQGPRVGDIAWHDLTVPDAGPLRDFYEGVVGWKSEPVDMDGYADFQMVAPESGNGVAGICHARGVGADLPPQWLVYIIVADLDESAAKCTALGGEVLVAQRAIGHDRFCVIKDPAGAGCALYERHSH